MASLSFNPTSGFNTNNQFLTSDFGSSQSNLLTPQQTPELNEVFLGQIISQIVVKAILSFDDPVTTQSGNNSSNPPQIRENASTNFPQNQPRPGDQISASGALTSQGGLSYGGGVRLGGGGVSGSGLSAVGTTTVSKSSYQTSGGISIGGISANAGVKLNSSGISFTGGLARTQVGQGIVGSRIGSGR